VSAGITTRCAAPGRPRPFGRVAAVVPTGAEVAPLPCVTFATSHLSYRVSDDRGADSVVIDVDPWIHSVPRWAAQLHGGHALDSFAVSIQLIAPGSERCESSFADMSDADLLAAAARSCESCETLARLRAFDLAIRSRFTTRVWEIVDRYGIGNDDAIAAVLEESPEWSDVGLRIAHAIHVLVTRGEL
jgi:hypothetical protein